MTKPLKEVIQGSTTLLKIVEKPLGIGIGIGLIAGAANAVILGIPMWLSLLAGSILGVLVCLIASPAMKTELKARREAEEKRSAALLSKTRVASAFTAFEQLLFLPEQVLSLFIFIDKHERNKSLQCINPDNHHPASRMAILVLQSEACLRRTL